LHLAKTIVLCEFDLH